MTAKELREVLYRDMSHYCSFAKDNCPKYASLEAEVAQLKEERNTFSAQVECLRGDVDELQERIDNAQKVVKKHRIEYTFPDEETQLNTVKDAVNKLVNELESALGGSITACGEQ